HTSLYIAIALLIITCPCALGLAVPVVHVIGAARLFEEGILMKDGAALERMAQADHAVFDKTGTLTVGAPQVSDVLVARREHSPASETSARLWHGSEEDLLALVATAEANSEHLLAKATVEEAKRRNIQVSETIAFEAVSGRGVRATVENHRILIGNRKFIEDVATAKLGDVEDSLNRLEGENKTVVLVAQEVDRPENAGAGEDPEVHVLGLVAFSDQLRTDAGDVVRDLKEHGVARVVMITGDNRETAQRIGDQVGVDEVYSELMPDEKLNVIESLEEKYGPVAMIGDGVNDAPALARASLGIAMGAAGTDVAMETADVVLMADELSKVAYVIALSRRTRRTLVFNLGLAGLLIAVMIVGIFTVQLPLPLAVVGHEGGTVLVSLNGLRLLFFRRPLRSAPRRSAQPLGW
ncbi:MAG: heavy metal translocating P-type ATPase, partial [Spirochaetes bacterium]|nr:heavy metal translocating P-type ATPase [Spirochaetota bacterium]